MAAFLSARVGSVGDNRLGGWHSYRASKAALNMILRNLAVELCDLLVPLGVVLAHGLGRNELSRQRHALDRGLSRF